MISPLLKNRVKKVQKSNFSKRKNNCHALTSFEWCFFCMEKAGELFDQYFLTEFFMEYKIFCRFWVSKYFFLFPIWFSIDWLLLCRIYNTFSSALLVTFKELELCNLFCKQFDIFPLPKLTCTQFKHVLEIQNQRYTTTLKCHLFSFVWNWSTCNCMATKKVKIFFYFYDGNTPEVKYILE